MAHSGQTTKPGGKAVIRIVTSHQYTDNQPLLTQMHRLRYRVFKERLGWDVECHGDQERDDFDLLNPVYILALDRDEDVVGCWRLLPTTGPNMLRDVFPFLLTERAVPEDPLTWECSRFAVDCPAEGDNCLSTLNRLTSELFCGLIHYCLDQGIEQVVTVYDLRIARILPRVGVHPQWRTKPQRIGKMSALVGLFDINEAVLGAVMRNAGITDLRDYGEGYLLPVDGSTPPSLLDDLQPGATLPSGLGGVQVHVG